MGLEKQAGTCSQLEAEWLWCLLFIRVLALAFTQNQLLKMLYVYVKVLGALCVCLTTLAYLPDVFSVFFLYYYFFPGRLVV